MINGVLYWQQPDILLLLFSKGIIFGHRFVRYINRHFVFFPRDQVVVHKTFHRYVVRAKRGTVQSQHDSSGKFAKSAGACIRRGQEAAFKDVF
jgi:hypothetical protein